MTIRPIVVWHTDTVEIRWDFPEGTKSFYQSITCPPQATREARQEAQEQDQADK